MDVTITVYKTDGTRETKTFIDPDDLLPLLQAEVGGYIEPVHNVQGLPKGKILIVNEEGLLHELPPNPFIKGIVGNAIVMDYKDLD